MATRVRRIYLLSEDYAQQQRLLENTTLTLEEAFRQARALEQAQAQSQSFNNNVVAAINDNPSSPADPQSLAAMTGGKNKTNNNNNRSNKNGYSTNPFSNNHQDNPRKQKQVQGDKCFFCNKSRHPRSVCPARDATCTTCNM